LHKKQRDRLLELLNHRPEWAFGFEDETWWSRLSHPNLHSWAEHGEFLKLIEQTHRKDDPVLKRWPAMVCMFVGLLQRRLFQKKFGYGL